MQTVAVRLESAVATSYRCTRAADALDIDVAKKSVHELIIADVNLDDDYRLGVIVGASGSGKTTLARSLWGEKCFDSRLDLARPVIDQFPDAWSYDGCAQALGGMGLTSVPCWIRPAYTLSNGQRARAEAALQLAFVDDSGVIVLDEWTSVVDRTVAKVMSHCLAKYARRAQKKIVVCTCHYDVLDWLDADWILDCNRAQFIDRRLLQCAQRARTDTLTFDIRRVERRTWRDFAKYHYLSANLPGGHIETFGLFHGANQIGFQCFANYVPHRRAKIASARGVRTRAREQMHSNRTVVHPDYAGFGLGIKLIDLTSAMMARDYDVRALFSSAPVYRAMLRDPHWAFDGEKRTVGTRQVGSKLMRSEASLRHNVTMYAFHYVGPVAPA